MTTTQISEHMLRLNLKITPTEVKNLMDLLISFEIRGVLALNTPLLGVHKIYFTAGDRARFFEIFGVTEPMVAKTIKEIRTIDKKHKVRSDPFNVLAFWLMHISYRDISKNDDRREFLMTVAKLVHYKFFTSTINHYLPYGTNEKIMTYVVNNLTRKFDIVVYGTWRKTIEARCEDLIHEEDSIHTRAITTAYDDEKFLYAITDTQTRMRDKIKNITDLYYDAKEKGHAIHDRSTVSTGTEGEKIITSATATFDVMIANLTTEVLSINVFINRELIESIASQFSNISVNMLTAALTSISQLASNQSVSQQLDQVIKKDDVEIYVGMRVLIHNLIQKSFRYTIKNHIDITNKAETYIRIKNVYSSSRIADQDILNVKESLVYLVDHIAASPRGTTKASLRIAILLYFISKSFAYV